MENPIKSSPHFRLAGTLPVVPPPVRGLIDINWKLCTGCRLCEHACSVFHEDRIWSEASRVIFTNSIRSDGHTGPLPSVLEPSLHRRVPGGAQSLGVHPKTVPSSSTPSGASEGKMRPMRRGLPSPERHPLPSEDPQGHQLRSVRGRPGVARGFALQGRCPICPGRVLTAPATRSLPGILRVPSQGNSTQPPSMRRCRDGEYQGNFLEVDLTNRRHKVTPLDLDLGSNFWVDAVWAPDFCGSGFRPVPIR